jgi:vacuolar-type H+-ATPase subunit E/Vma4
MAEAQALGLDSEVQRLRARLHNLRASLKQEIEAVTSRGSLESLQALLARAEHAGLSQEDVAAATSRMTARQEAAGQDVVEQARTGALVAYKRAR